MSTPITLTLAILGGAVLLFVTERIRIDLIALLVLSALALTDLVTQEEALSGFSSPAVITVWAVFILSAGLARTGVAGWMGRQVMRLGGKSELRVTLVFMIIAAFLSAFMNNVGVTALLLPVTLDICRRTHWSPSRMLIPLAFSSLLGGMTTLIGTPPNILVNDILIDFGYQPFNLFDFAPVGGAVLLGGIIYLALVGRFLLPKRSLSNKFEDANHEMTEAFAIEDRLFVINIPLDSPLQRLTLAQSRLGSALLLNVIAITRSGHKQLAPGPEFLLKGGDELLVTGKPDKLFSWCSGDQLIVKTQKITPLDLVSDEVKLVEIGISADSALVGKTLVEAAFRQNFGGAVISIWRGESCLQDSIDQVPLKSGDHLILQVTTDQFNAMHKANDFTFHEVQSSKIQELADSLLMIEIPASSDFCEKTIAESHLGDAYGLGIFGILRGGKTILIPEPTQTIMPGDNLLVRGKKENITALQGLQGLTIDYEAHPTFEDMESERIGLVEVVLSPHSSLSGRTLRQINFREKFGLSVLAIYRAGQTKRSNLRDLPLRFGDALLVFGPREKLRLLAQEPDFLVLTEQVQAPPRSGKAPIAALLMLGVVFVVGMNWLPIALAAVMASALMILTGCLTMSEAYQAIEWKAIFLIAGMLPLGIALQTSGTARYLADKVLSLSEPFGIYALLGGLFLLTLFASQVMPNPVVTVLMAPIALTAAIDLNYSPFAFMMVVAVAASASFLSPVGHPSNILVMGPGGYKFGDYFKVGLPLAVITLVIILLVLPVFWPLTL